MIVTKNEDAGADSAVQEVRRSHERCDATLTGKRAARGGRTEVEKYHTGLMILSFII